MRKTIITLMKNKCETTRWEGFFKRLLDIAAAGLGILVLSPLFLATAFLVKCTSCGPVFFVQRRVGLHGRRFTIYKFRTMYIGAGRMRKRLAARNIMNGPVFKVKNDPRITPVGKVLRRFSIDELPQLYNVLLGDMSLTGPRPPIPAEVVRYTLWQRRRLAVRPGLTCLWQVNGRNNIDFEEWVRLDLKYIDNWSLWLDFKILLKTIPAVLFGSGAY